MDADEDSGSSRSALALAASNLVTIPVAVWLDWHASEILWIYLIQSFIIGFFSMARIVGLRALEPRPEGAVEFRNPGLVVFFLFFHLFFVAALLAWQGFAFDAGMAIVIGAFLVQSALDYRRDQGRDASEGTPDPDKISFLALARTLPFFLMLGATAVHFDTRQQLVYLLCIKTVADSALHPAGYGDTRSGPPSPDFTVMGIDVYFPFNRTVGFTIAAVLLVAAYSFYFGLGSKYPDLAAVRAFDKSFDAMACNEFNPLVMQARDAARRSGDRAEVPATWLETYKRRGGSSADQARFSAMMEAASSLGYRLRTLSWSGTGIAYQQLCRQQFIDGAPKPDGVPALDQKLRAAEDCEGTYPAGDERLDCVARAFKSP